MPIVMGNSHDQDNKIRDEERHRISIIYCFPYFSIIQRVFQRVSWGHNQQIKTTKLEFF